MIPRTRSHRLPLFGFVIANEHYLQIEGSNQQVMAYKTVSGELLGPTACAPITNWSSYFISLQQVTVVSISIVTRLF